MLFGTDPEVFSCVKHGNNYEVISPALLEVSGQIIPCGGNLKHPVYIDEKEFSWMMDGVAFELTVKKPLQNSNEVYTIINNSIDCLKNYVNKLTWKGEKLHVVKRPVVNIDPMEYIPNLENEKIYQGFIFGCDPDEDGIETDYECNTVDVSTHIFRYGGGHIHFSGNEKLFNYPRPAIQLLALFVGNFCIANSLYPELEQLRSGTYGKPGRFRKQIYPNGDKGIEYRTPSNSWISYTKTKMQELFYLGEKAISYLDDFEKGKELINDYLPQTIEAIKNADQELAENILKELA